MAISKSTPYVRYKKDFTSSLHLGTIHIESEYLDRTQKTTIESIHGMTWHNKVVNENKELNLLSDTQLELTDLEKQYWNTGEKRVSVDEIHTLEEVEPNEDGTYTYTVNSMEGEYIEIYDGINNITSTSDGLDGQFEIVYDTTEEDVSGNIALDQVVSQYEITDSGVGVITSAKSTGLTLVNHITESSKEEVVAIEQQEGKHFTINNTVQGNIKSAILKGDTLVNITSLNGEITIAPSSVQFIDIPYIKSNTIYTISFNCSSAPTTNFIEFRQVFSDNALKIENVSVTQGYNRFKVTTVNKELNRFRFKNDATSETDFIFNNLLILEGDYTNVDIPYFEGIGSVKMPVLTTSNEDGTKTNILSASEDVELRGIGDVKDELNLLTGELTQRIGEVVFDGSDDENWWYAGESDTIIRSNITINIKWITQILCADMPADTPNLGTVPYQFEGVANHFENYIYLYLKKEKIENYSDDLTNIDKLKMIRDWLSKNPITIQYQLETESVKTVDLTVQNQDGNTIPRIQTQQGITHVSTSSDGLIPVVEMSCSYDTIIKPNTTYTIKLDRPNVSDTMYLQVDLGGTMMMLDADVNAFTIKTPSTLSHSQLRLSGTGNTVKEIIVLEGNRVNDKIEYFEGMKNVENPILVVSNCPYVFGKGGRK